MDRLTGWPVQPARRANACRTRLRLEPPSQKPVASDTSPSQSTLILSTGSSVTARSPRARSSAVGTGLDTLLTMT